MAKMPEASADLTDHFPAFLSHLQNHADGVNFRVIS